MVVNRLRQLCIPASSKIGLLITLITLVIYWIGVPFLHLVELKAYDFHFLSRGTINHSGEVVIVAIDEKSLDKFGRWPWQRKRMAQLTGRLKTYGAKVIAFDMVFSEPDESSGINTIRGLKRRLIDKGSSIITEIEQVEKEADNDAIFASTLKNTPAVIAGYFFQIGSQRTMKIPLNPPFSKGEINSPTLVKGGEGGFDDNENTLPRQFSSIRYIEKGAPSPVILTASNVVSNIPRIAASARDSGYFNILNDPDGTVRSAPLCIQYKDGIYPHIALEIIRKYLDSPPLILNVAGYGVDSINIGDYSIPADERGRLLINFRGPQMTFPHYSFSDVVDGRVPEEALRDKIVLIGITATGIYDTVVTPFDSVSPGVEIQANIIDTILQGDFIYRPDWMLIFDVLAILIFGTLLTFSIPRMRAVYTIIATVVLVVLYMGINHYIFRRWGLWLTMDYPILTILSVSASVTTFQFMTEERKGREVKEAFSHYVAPSLVNEIVKNPEMLELGGEEKRLTVMFSDIRDFTTISEGLKPHALVRLMNDYLTPMTNIILNNSGTVDKYMGDAIMAFWGAPVEQPDHPVKACRTALEMVRRLDDIQSEWKERGIPKIRIGIGISTGRLTVGNMGSSTRFDYTVMGDTVNLCSRLEGLNKEYGTQIIVPKYTYEDVKDAFILRELDSVRVKGKEIPIRIYELMGDRHSSDDLQKVAELFEAALNAYRKKDWDKADACLLDVLKLKPDDGPSTLFLSRIKELRNTELPTDWDGVFVMTKK